jgi:enoyl-CoA hydratase/carnithine racemase
MTDLVQHESIGHVSRLTLNSPENFNALSMAMIAELSATFDRVAQDKQIRVVILRGAGRAFCAGHDLKEMQAARQAPDAGAAHFNALFTACAKMMQQITSLPQPVIAEAHGIATAAGCQLVATCDMGVAAAGTRFGVNGIDIGLFCTTPMVALTRAIPPKAAFEMLTTGAFIDAQRACELGLINRVVPEAELSEATLALAQTVAAKLPTAIVLGKRAFHQQRGQDLAEAYQLATDQMCENALWSGTAEGTAAFLEKRKPQWKEPH